MARRALFLVPNSERKAKPAVSDHPEREDRDTDHASGAMPSAERVTTVPPPPRVPAEMRSPIVGDASDSVEPPGYDPDKWEHYKIARLVESLGVVRAGLAAVSPASQEALITKAASAAATEVANRFRPIVEAAERRVMGEVSMLGREQKRTNDDVSELRRDLAKLERRIADIEREQEAKRAAQATPATR